MGIFLVASLIQTMIIVNDENYLAPSWQCTLLALLACAIAFAGNVYGAKVLPYWQNAVFAVHVLAYFGYIIPIWVSAPKATHHQVWGEFSNSGGWSNIGMALMVGQLAGVSQQVGIDTVCLVPFRSTRVSLTALRPLICPKKSKMLHTQYHAPCWPSMSSTSSSSFRPFLQSAIIFPLSTMRSRTRPHTPPSTSSDNPCQSAGSQ